MTKGIIRMRFS